MTKQNLIDPSPKWTTGERQDLTIHFAQMLCDYATTVRRIQVTSELVADIMERIEWLQTKSASFLERRRRRILQPFYEAVEEHT